MRNIIKITLLILTISVLTACGTSPDNTPRASMGSKAAKVVIDEFSDFECPACANIGPQLEAIAKKNSDKVRLDFYHFPLSYHKNAFIAAEAAECANEQGKFWEFAQLNFKNQKVLTEDNLKTFAKNLKLDTVKFNKCLDSGIKKSKIRNDIAEGNRRKLGYTPSIYVNKKLVEWSGAEAFESYIKGLAQ